LLEDGQPKPNFYRQLLFLFKKHIKTEQKCFCIHNSSVWACRGKPVRTIANTQPFDVCLKFDLEDQLRCLSYQNLQTFVTYPFCIL
jgi:hypothetical protein